MPAIREYAEAADILVTFENFGNEYRNNYTPPVWVDNYSADHFAHIVHTEPTSANMLIDVALARFRKAGMIYVTHGAAPDRYNQIPSYWTEEVNALSLTTHFVSVDVGGNPTSWKIDPMNVSGPHVRDRVVVEAGRLRERSLDLDSLGGDAVEQPAAPVGSGLRALRVGAPDR